MTLAGVGTGLPRYSRGMSLRPVLSCAWSVALHLAACASDPAPRPAGGRTTPTAVADDGKTELERRQAAACAAVGERTTACAVADAKAKATPAELRELELDQTAPRNTEKFVAECVARRMSSRQVRVFEVCYREERECEPFFSCLEHAKPQPAPR